MDENLTPDSGGLPAVQGKPVAAPKGYGYSLPTPAGGVPVPSSILDELERIYQRKVAAQNPFQEWMKDIAAWGAPGGPATREQEKSMREQELFRMRADIASGRTAQQQLAQDEMMKRQILGLGGIQTGQGGVPGGIELSPEEKIALGLAKPGAEFNKLLNQFVTERVKGRTGTEAEKAQFDVQYLDQKGQIVYDLVDLRTKENLRRSGRLISATSVTTPAISTPPAAAATPPAAAATPPAAAATPPAAAITDQFKFENLTPEQIEIARGKARALGLQSDVFSRPDAAELFNKQPLERRRSFFGSMGTVLAPAAPVAPEPATPEPTQVAQAPVQPRPIPQIKAEQKFQEQRGAELAKIEAADQASHMESAKTAIDRERTASETIKLLYEDPTITGFFQKPGVAAALGTLIKSGISAPGGHSIGVRELDEVLFRGQKTVTPEQIAARDRLRSLLNKASLFLTSALNKGQGAVSNYERELYANLVGSLDNTPENIVKIQKTLLENAKMRRNIDKAWKDSNMAWGDFIKSTKYQEMEQAYDKALEKIENEKVVFGVPNGRVEIKPFDKEKEAEYQRWAAEQRKQKRR